jgi:hypothetical protein
MGVSLELSVASVVIEVGGEASLQVTVRNTGSVIDEASLSLLGAAAAWAVVEPGTLSLLPGSEGAAQVHFRPPRSASIPAGRTPFGVMAASREDPDGSMVEEGTVEITRLVDVAAELNPRTSRGQREGIHDLTVNNRGNAPITVEVAATDPGDLLYLSVTPPQLVIEPGGMGSARIVAQARWELEQGSPQTIPFKVTVTPEGDAATTIDGALVQEPKEQPKPAEAAAPASTPPAAPPVPARPSQLPKLLAGLVALAVVAVGGLAVATGAVKLGGGGGGDGSDTEAGQTTVPSTTGREPGDPTSTTKGTTTTTTIGGGAGQTAGTVTFKALPDGSPLPVGGLLTGTEFTNAGVRLSGVPSAACPQATAVAVRSFRRANPPFNVLTSADPADVTSCNNARVRIDFTKPVKSVRLVFTGEPATYVAELFGPGDRVLGSEQATVATDRAPVEIQHGDQQGISAVVFGREGALTALKEIHFRR